MDVSRKRKADAILEEFADIESDCFEDQSTAGQTLPNQSWPNIEQLTSPTLRRFYSSVVSKAIGSSSKSDNGLEGPWEDGLTSILPEQQDGGWDSDTY